MSHPKDRRDRFLLGVNKSKKRVSLMFSDRFSREHPEVIERTLKAHRDTTKRCGGPCCVNPRHNGWNPGRGGLTRQELKFEESLE